MTEAIPWLERFYRVPAEPLAQAAERGDALLGFREIEAAAAGGGGLECFDLGYVSPLVHPWCYLPARSYLSAVTGLGARDLGRVARYEAYVRVDPEGGGRVREVFSADEARREIERDPDEQYFLLTGDEGLGQCLYQVGGPGALRDAEDAVRRAEAETGRLFPPREARRAWRIGRARGRLELLRVLAGSEARREAVMVHALPVARAWEPWAARRERLDALCARLRAADASMRAAEPRSPEERRVRGEAQRVLEELCATVAGS